MIKTSQLLRAGAFYGLSKAGRAWETKTNQTVEMPLLPVVIIGELKVTSDLSGRRNVCVFLLLNRNYI